MTADTIGADGRAAGLDPGGPREMTPRDMTPGGIAASALLHGMVLALVLLGIPNLFRKPPPQDMPIAVQLVTIAPETRATHPNPFRPQPEAKPEPPRAQPAPVPEPKPEPPMPSPAPPPSAAATAAPPPSPPLEAQPVAEPAAPAPPKPEPKPIPAPPPLPPKPVEARAPVVPPPVPEHKPKPKPERQPVRHAEAKPKPEPQHTPRAAPKPEVRPEAKQADPAAFGKLLQDLESQEKKDQPDAFDSLLKNLTKQHTARTEEPPPAPRRVASLSPPSAQPKAPLGTELTASELDVVRQQLSRCWNIPAGARDAGDLVIAIRGTIAPDGRVLQATIVDQGRLGDPFFRAAAESARRAFFHPLCTPLRLPPEKYESWKTFEIELSPKDIL